MIVVSVVRSVVVAAAILPVVPLHLSGQIVDTAAALVALAELDDACDRVEQIWPVPLCGPVVLVDRSSRIAIANRPDPDGRFDAIDGGYAGTLPADVPVANTSVDWSGERWAMVMLPLRGDRFSRLALLAHESFHRIQPALGHDSSDPLATHLDEEHARVWLRLELRALARSLVLHGATARTAASDALLFRAVRQCRYPGAAELEAQLEAHEGVAEYTGVRFALDATGAGLEQAAARVSGFESRPTYVRSLGYGTGPALGLLLDRYDPGWRQVAGSHREMARRLATVLDAPAAVERLAMDRGRDYELDVVAAEEAERAVRITALRERYRAELIHGPVLVLELPERRLMFNPNTVLALGDDGNVYPGAILFGPWGRLTLNDGAALATAERDRAWVVAPTDLEPDEQGVVTGPGWTLELDPEWHLAPGPRPGDVHLEEAAGS